MDIKRPENMIALEGIINLLKTMERLFAQRVLFANKLFMCIDAHQHDQVSKELIEVTIQHASCRTMIANADPTLVSTARELLYD